MTLAAPTARPPTSRKNTNWAVVMDAPHPSALITNRTLVITITGLRPKRLASRPANRAPTAQPSSTDATENPVPAVPAPKAFSRASTVPLMTELSKPNRKPPTAAAHEIMMTNGRVA